MSTKTISGSQAASSSPPPSHPLHGTSSPPRSPSGFSSLEIGVLPTSPKNSSSNLPSSRYKGILDEIWCSTELLFSSKLTWLLVFGPVALAGNATGILPEAACFVFAGLALIPCAERLSFVTEQVAEHTNGTIGALLNATFGNAPEFLISSAALRSGYYRLVQLTLLGSILCNLLFVFGLSCLVGGLRWQVQELRITSGNVSIGMLLIASMGLTLPAALKLTNEEDMTGEITTSSQPIRNSELISDGDIGFSRFNALIMVVGYVAYLIFQLGTHKDEFDYSGEEYAAFGGGHNIIRTPQFAGRRVKRKARTNKFCRRYCPGLRYCCPGNDQDMDRESEVEYEALILDVERDGARMNGEKGSELCNQEEGVILSNGSGLDRSYASHCSNSPSLGTDMENDTFEDHPQLVTKSTLMPQSIPVTDEENSDFSSSTNNSHRRRKTAFCMDDNNHEKNPQSMIHEIEKTVSDKCHLSDGPIEELENETPEQMNNEQDKHEAQMSFRTGLFWLFVITLCISSMSDILIDTIDGFADRSQMSEVFTSVVIIPYFSNIAEQVSAVIFAYRNEMDLCIGVTVGSAVQIAMLVMPGCVLVGWLTDRSMSLFFRGYETVCLVMGVLCVAAVLQGGTTNWLVGMVFIGVYFMIASGFWYHDLEDLSIDNELFIHNATATPPTEGGL